MHADCLLWIGGRYTVRSFLQEARERGVCRKIPSWPVWLQPGKSRCFLAHQGGLKPESGVIFGYFVPKGMDVVIGDWRLAEYRRLCREVERGGDPRRLERFWREEFTGGLPVEGVVRAGERPGEEEPPDDDRGKRGKDDLIDYLVDVLIECDVDPHVPDTFPIPNFRTRLENERLCGLRPFETEKTSRRVSRSALYVIDALTRAIDELFCELIKEIVKEGLKGVIRPTSDKRADARRRAEAVERLEKLRDDLIARTTARAATGSLEEFDEAMRRAGKRRLGAPKVAPILAGNAKVDAQVVVFETPYPIFDRRPRAAFRSLLVIDGDKLLAEIAATYDPKRVRELGDLRARKVTIPFLREEEKPATHAALVDELATRCRIQKALANELLGSFTEVLGDELRDNRRVAIGGLGVFTARERAERWGTNPATGERIKIPERTHVHFRASQALKRRLAPARGAAPSGW